MRRAVIVVARMVADGFARAFVELPVGYKTFAPGIDFVNVRRDLFLRTHDIPDTCLADFAVKLASGRVRVADVEEMLLLLRIDSRLSEIDGKKRVAALVEGYFAVDVDDQ